MPGTMLTSDSIDRYLNFMSGNGASPHTIRAYRIDLHLFLDSVEPTTDPDSLESCAAAWLTANRSLWSPKTTGRRLTTLRSWARWAGYDRFLASYRQPTPARPLPHPIPEGIDGVVAMYHAARSPEHQALVVLCGMLGLRVSEARSITLGDFSPDDTVLTVRGKGDKFRHVPVSGKVLAYLEPAMSVRRLGHPADHSDVRLVPLSDSSARMAIRRMARRAGLSRGVSSHDLRMTFGTAAYHLSGDLRAVQELLGHASSATTELYTHVPMEKMAAAAAVV